jgi:hypothetical protein
MTNVGANRAAVYPAFVASPHARCPRRRVAAGASLLPVPARRRQGRLLRDRDAGEAVARPVRLRREIVWSDGYHRVRTPLVVRVANLPDDGIQVATAG